MDSGLTVKWDDRLHPSQRHFDRMADLGVPKHSVTPNLSKFTSEVMKVCFLFFFVMSEILLIFLLCFFNKLKFSSLLPSSGHLF